MKSYRSSCAKEKFAYIERTKTGKYAVRWNPVESTEGEGEEARVIVSYNEAVVATKPTYGAIVSLIVRERYTADDELAMARQSYAAVSDYEEYNAYVEQCKKWACEALGTEYVPTYAPTQAEVMTQLRTLVSGSVEELPDDKAVDVPALFEPWKPNEDVSAGIRRYYGGKLYKCVQPHRTQSDWTPDVSPALWTIVSVEEFPEWVQPTGAQDAYSKGDKVSHNGEHWVSDIDANTWEPGAYGWTPAN